MKEKHILMSSIKKKQRRATAKARPSSTKTSRPSVKADDKRLPLHDLLDSETDKALDMHLLSLATKLRTIYEDCMKKTDSPQSCHSRMMEEAAYHFNELKEEAQLMVGLQHKALRGEVLSDSESTMHRALQLKQRTIQSNTSELQKAQHLLQQARQQQNEVQQLCKHKALPLKELSKLFQQAQMMYSQAMQNVKRKLSTLLSHDWALKTLLAISFAGITGWGVHRALLSTVVASTALLHEANQMAHTIAAVTNIIQVSSHEGAKWTLGGLGGAVGAAHGFMLSKSILPGGPPGSTAASMLSAAVMGAFVGVKALI